MKHHLTARPCQGEDYEFVYDLKKQCYHDYVAAIWGWEEEKQRELFAAYWEKAAPGLFILLLDGVPVGFLDGEVQGERYELGNLCLLPEQRGKGLGSKVLKDLLDKVPGGRVGLQVFKSNPARRLYERLGFQTTGETDHHYQMEGRKTL